MVEPSQKPACIISDVFLPWTAQVASKFGIPRVVFHTTGAMAASLLQYFFTNPVSDITGDRQIIEICDHCINVNLRRSQLPQMLRSESSALFMLVNTFDWVEAEYVGYLEESTGKPVWGVANPLHRPQHGIDNESECIRWLDTQKQNSVLYVSFGSQAFLSEEQTKALARGIAASKQCFIWTIKDPVGSNVNSCDFLPEGFIEEMKDRGMVIHGWVPQLLILSHPSTAFFMTHCGWNSTLESISAGVPMVVWPMGFDQFINAKLVTEHLGLGLQICEGLDAIPSSDIVENTVKAAMATEIGEDMRLRALKIKESINEASCKLSGMEGFLSYVLSLC
ncbi:scopoletin glucosyltransferase [Cryptomeria japonica]|uniref:scopoletin glucosyltransferase n=1 Tax=Cryptomeria japonica TaxID=3369 RepID=UPI0025AB7FBE|nr:scopoletin glucosyltransferase [Cryptomeria japonica]